MQNESGRIDRFALDSPAGKTIKVQTLREAVYSYVRDAIVRQAILPAERLHDKAIAKHLGVSVTPVREAFLKLHAEGYLEFNTYRSVIVKPISHAELVEIYQVISVLDGFAAKLAFERKTDEFLQRLRDATSRMDRFFKKNMVEDYLNLNASVHSLIWEAANNKHLLKALENIQNQMLRYQKERLSLYSKLGYMKKSMRSHRSILEFFQNSADRGIEQLVRDHWNLFTTLGQDC